ncbi:hypothetical protein QUB80_04170 [Chlorogloeopsis sp. ULAP01]|uniref:hypothetical protein n=1 Tax=Chlorogloeopsis sp. ULAP01 TaxID=3056483 RepID=UPI0025AA5BC9|nr:hypothetical protein [Chlorogloeopsis sp. ULAP01]MDM9379894.1 hypothetical protein [Chlorogloeopsis sp. ULAP01]
MKKVLFVACCLGLIATVSTALAQNFISNQSSSINVDSDNDMKGFSSFSEQSSYSSGYQQSSLNLSAANLNKPNILRINTSGTQLNGAIILNGKVVKRLNNNKVEINLSPLLSVGEHKVEISGRYIPKSSGINIEFSGPGTNIVQQTSGNGILNYVLEVSVY